jgi:hypothetical protein
MSSSTYNLGTHVFENPDAVESGQTLEGMHGRNG